MRKHLALNLSLALALLIFVCLVSTAVAVGSATPPAGLNTGAGPWQWINPTVQGATISGVSFVDASTGWGVGLDGTILKTVNGGDTWSAQKSGTMANLNGVRFVDAGNGWAVGADGITQVGVILHTTDGGANWSTQTAPSNAALDSVHFINTLSGIAVGNGVAFYTSNGGVTWSAGTGVNGSDYLASVQMLDANNAWAVGSQGAIYRTSNGGVTWIKHSVLSAGTDLRAVYMIDANTGFAVSSNPGGGRLFRYANHGSGADWEASTSTVSTALWGVTFTNGNLLAVGDDGKIMKYTPANPVTDSLDAIASGLTNVGSGTTSRLLAITAVTVSTVYASGDGGAITRSATSGDSWTMKAGGDSYNMMGASFVSPDVGWVAGANGAVFHTIDGGAGWSSDNSGIPANVNINSLQFINGSTGFLAGCQGTGSPCSGAGVAYKYSSGTWTAMSVPGGITRLNSIHMSDSTHGWAVGPGGQAISTANGSTWTLTATGIPATVVLNGVDTTTAGNGWAVGCQLTGSVCTEGVLYKYAAGSWSKATLASPPTFMNSVDMVDGTTTGYAVGNSGKGYKTTDGTAWSAMNTGTGKLLASISFAPGDTSVGFAAGEYGRIIHTINGGATWSAEDLGTNVSMFAVSTISARKAYVAGSNSAVLKALRPYYFTWYDNVYSADWVLTANPKDAPGDLWFDLFIAGAKRDMTPLTGTGCPGGGACAAGQIPPGRSQNMLYTGLLGGPVNAASMTSDKGIVSQRIIWAGNSLEEVLGTDIEKLSDHFYWTWYDQSSAGMSNWILVANPNPYTVYYKIKKGGVDMQALATIPPGGSVTPQFPGQIGGPVEVQAWTTSGMTAPANVMASQRVLSNGGWAFNEVPGIPARELTNDYLWTWYDQQSPGATDWVLVANPGDTDVTYAITIGGSDPGPGSRGTIPAHGKVTPTFAGVQNGPVEVTASGNVIASQRVIFGRSFEEVPGYAKTALSSDYHWTWYDQNSPGMTNWVLVANPDPVIQVYYEITLGSGELLKKGTIDPGQKVTPTFPTKIGGPVEVRAWTDSGKATAAKVMTSQRVLHNGFFNEVLGMVLN
ncbi:MAG: YCF48-related protein [Thermoleophilia bacterium]